ncbi:MAG: LemA family protein [Bryobacteraceae bacterium]
MKIGLIILGVILLVALIFGSKLTGTRNELVQLKNSIDGTWAEVDVQLQRRADLIPNIVSTVKGFAKQEQEVLNNIANARAGLLNARSPQEKIQANSQLDSALGRLLVVVENYPQLKSNENFLRLQDELAGTENRLAIARRRYNETVQRYNTTIDLFPNNIAAALFGFQRNDAYFKTDPAARTAPKVAF